MPFIPTQFPSEDPSNQSGSSGQSVVLQPYDTKANQSEATIGTDNTKWMTPLRTFQAIASWVSSNLSLSWNAITGKPSNFPPTSHNHAISDITNLQSELDGKQASGSYATLTDGKVPSAQLPSYVDDVIEYASTSNFPSTGESGKIYVATSTGKIYRWGGSSYVEISPSPGSTDSVTEGSVNKYFTAQRAADAAPVQEAPSNGTQYARKNGAWEAVASSLLSATAFSASHFSTTGGQYQIGTLVWYGGHVFRCIATNDSIEPQIGGNAYWADLGEGYLIEQDVREAPQDNKDYARKNGTWAPIANGNPFDQSLNTTDSPTFDSITIANIIYAPYGNFYSQDYYLHYNSDFWVDGFLYAAGGIGSSANVLNPDGSASFGNGAVSVTTDGYLLGPSGGWAGPGGNYFWSLGPDGSIQWAGSNTQAPVGPGTLRADGGITLGSGVGLNGTDNINLNPDGSASFASGAAGFDTSGNATGSSFLIPGTYAQDGGSPLGIRSNGTAAFGTWGDAWFDEYGELHSAGVYADHINSAYFKVYNDGISRTSWYDSWGNMTATLVTDAGQLWLADGVYTDGGSYFASGAATIGGDGSASFASGAATIDGSGNLKANFLDSVYFKVYNDSIPRTTWYDPWGSMTADLATDAGSLWLADGVYSNNCSLTNYGVFAGPQSWLGWNGQTNTYTAPCALLPDGSASFANGAAGFSASGALLLPSAPFEGPGPCSLTTDFDSGGLWRGSWSGLEALNIPLAGGAFTIGDLTSNGTNLYWKGTQIA